ncbi:MAG: DedA family protein [Actinobacteria bacterium]|nr:MAG: DedA family protein [Actinomycetota bacterium]
MTGLLEQYGYLAIVALVFVESFGVPAPGQTIIIVGAAYASHGHLDVVAVGLCAFVAAVVGDCVGYLIGRYGGHRLVLRFGRYVRLTRDRLMRVERFMARHGPRIVAVARFVDGLRQLNGVVAGTVELPWRRFLLFNAIGAALWVGVWATAGYLAGDRLDDIFAAAFRYQWLSLAVLLVLGGGYAVLHVRRRRARTRQETG